jgi:hypothetical protein
MPILAPEFTGGPAFATRRSAFAYLPSLHYLAGRMIGKESRMGNGGRRRRLVSALALTAIAGLSLTPVTVAGAQGLPTRAPRRKKSSTAKQIKALKEQTTALAGEVSSLSAKLTTLEGRQTPPSGPAGGSLSGSYPNPALAPGSVGSADFAAGAVAPEAALFGGAIPAAFQKRVGSACVAGEAIREISAAGTVTCQPTAQSLGYSGTPVVSPTEVTLGTIGGFTLKGRCVSTGTTDGVSLTESSSNTFTLSGWLQTADDIVNGGSASPTFSDYSFLQFTGSGTVFGTSINNGHSRHVWGHFFLTKSDGSVLAVTARIFVDSGLAGATPTCQISGIASLGA